MLTIRFYLTGLVMALLSATGGAALAAGAGQVQHLSGTMTVQRPDGTVRILSQKSEVNPGEVLTTQKDSYAQVNFSDGSSVTLRPNTQMKLESYQFVQDKPQEDSAFFRLIKGGLRTVTGLVGKRGNQDAYRIGTSTATIGIRGSGGDTFHSGDSLAGVVPGGEKIAANTTLHTTFTGSYIMQNEHGFELIGEGEWGSTDGTSKPVKIKDPGLKTDLLGQVLDQLSAGNCVVK
jgi:hypothetical protein